jgi:hypothetical protein
MSHLLLGHIIITHSKLIELAAVAAVVELRAQQHARRQWLLLLLQQVMAGRGQLLCLQHTCSSRRYISSSRWL